MKLYSLDHPSSRLSLSSSLLSPILLFCSLSSSLHSSISSPLHSHLPHLEAMAHKRTRSLDLDKSKAFAEAKDDINQDSVHRAYMGMLAFDVRKLDMHTYKNREVDTEHVASLVDSFKKGVRRFFKETRLRASMTPDAFNELLSRAAAATNLTHEPDTSMISLERSRCFGTEGGKLDDFVSVRNWHDDLPKPALIAGQHRARALMILLDEQNAQAAEKRTNADGEVITAAPDEVRVFYNL